MNELRIYEQLLLLALKDKEGTILVDFIEYALAGAILSDLLKENYVKVDQNNKIILGKDDSELEDSLLKDSITLIYNLQKKKDMKYWIYKIASIKDIKHRAAQKLCDRQILKADQDKILFIFNRKIYPELNPDPERRIMMEIEEAVFTEKEHITENTMILIALADSVDLLRKIYGSKRMKPYKKRIKAIINGNMTASATREIIEACQVAIIIAAIMPAIIASSTASH